jgi:3-oxoacyl-[acyl-carrier-protein] synthase-3
MDTTDEWIQERTGIKERRYVEPGEGPSDLAIPATEQALDTAGLEVKDIDFMIFATSTPDFYAPGAGCLLQDKMGFNEIGALDIRVQCSGFLYGLSIAEQYIKTGVFKNILLIGAEVQSTAMDLTTEGRDTAVIFGDGAGAAIISATAEDRGILSTHMHSEGKYLKELWLESPASNAGHPRISSNDLNDGKQYLKMNGREVFRHAVTRFPEVIHECLEKNNLTTDEIDLLIPHQANLRITQMVQKKLGLKDEQVYSNIHKYGNTTAGTIPIALAEVVNKGKVYRGDIVILASFGSGFTWASAAIKW